MQQNYNQTVCEGPLEDLCDDEMWLQHVIQDEHELLVIDMMLSNALSQVSD